MLPGFVCYLRVVIVDVASDMPVTSSQISELEFSSIANIRAVESSATSVKVSWTSSSKSVESVKLELESDTITSKDTTADDERSLRRRELSVTSTFLIWSDFTPSITAAIAYLIAAFSSSATLLASRPSMVIDAETDTVSDMVEDGEGTEVEADDGAGVGNWLGGSVGSFEG